MDEPKVTTRQVGIDFFRYISFLFVAVLHSLSAKSEDISVVGLVDHLCRFAVPFFFITSGYFLGLRQPETMAALSRMIKRLLPVFLFWMIFYIFAFKSYSQLGHWRFIYDCLISGGPGFHLWFLPALGTSIFSVLVLRRFGWPMLFTVALALYAFGLAFGAYRHALALPDIAFRTRNGPFFGFFFVMIGYWIGSTNINTSLRMGIILSIVGYSMQVMEAHLISVMTSGPFAPYDFLIGTALFGTGVFIIALNTRKNSFIEYISRLGPITLGMYCVHALFLRFGQKHLDNANIPDAFILAFFVIAASTVLSYTANKAPPLRRLFS